jgi:hypothetical protein
MPLYKYSTFLFQVEHAEFDKLYSPGARTPWSGIYKCHGCGHEVVHTTDKPLPPQNHHQHNRNQGAIQWRLVVTDSLPPAS